MQIFGKRKGQKGKAEGVLTVTDQDQTVIQLDFEPRKVDVCFTDKNPPPPSCNPMVEDAIDISSEGKCLHLSWSVSQPRQVKWVAKR